MQNRIWVRALLTAGLICMGVSLSLYAQSSASKTSTREPARQQTRIESAWAFYGLGFLNKSRNLIYAVYVQPQVYKRVVDPSLPSFTPAPEKLRLNAKKRITEYIARTDPTARSRFSIDMLAVERGGLGTAPEALKQMTAELEKANADYKKPTSEDKPTIRQVMLDPYTGKVVSMADIDPVKLPAPKSRPGAGRID